MIGAVPWRRIRLRRAIGALDGLLGEGRHAAAILMYHRIARAACDPWGLCVTPERFRDQLLALRARRHVMPMDDLVDALECGKVPPRATALTFDDGYADNFDIAKPLLEELRVPATMFLTTGVIGNERPFWWDELADLVLLGRSGARFDFEVAGVRLRAAWEAQDAVPEDLAAWRIHQATSDPRRQAYVDLWRTLQAMEERDRDLAMSRLREALHDGERLAAVGSGLPMSQEAARAMPSAMVSLGGHGRSHTPLPLLPADRLDAEVAGGRADIAELGGGKPPTGHSYPHGECDRRSRDAVGRAGFRWAVTTRSAKVDPRGCDVLALPRIEVRNWTGRHLLWRLRVIGRDAHGVDRT